MKLIKHNSTGNFTELQINSLMTVYFSYETPIALVKNGEVMITKNNWGTTTGKHINKVKSFYNEFEVVEHDNLMFNINVNI